MSSILGPAHPDRPDEAIRDLPTEIPDEDLDRPIIQIKSESRPASGNEIQLPPLILGCATFGYGIYQTEDGIVGSLPLRVIRLALRAGITAFDTSPYYHPSEIILGRALSRLRNEFPRNSYTLITKTGKYGARIEDHIYDPIVTRKSVERSLARLSSDYLDIVYLHDVEFRADIPFPSPAGYPLRSLAARRHSPENETPFAPLGPGEQSILDSFVELRKMQQEGKIRKIGIAGFSLPFLLRISLLVKNTTGRPVDVVQSYAHQTLLNSSLSHGYIEAFEQAGVEQVVSAAPLAMGALTTLGGPDWHPLRKAESGNFYAATRDAANLCAKQGTTLENVASDFGYQPVHHSDGRPVPVVVGCKDLDEVHRALSSYEGVGRSGKGSLDLQLEVRRLFEACGAADWSWASPGPEYFV